MTGIGKCPDLSNRKEILQFELWNECKEYRCKFCSLTYTSKDDSTMNPNFICPPERKAWILDRCSEYIDTMNWEVFDQISLQGGEIMNEKNQEWLPSYDAFLDKIFGLMENDTVKRLFLITSLKYQYAGSLLEYTINRFLEKGLINYLLVGTSYDLKYRFTEELEKRWWDNLAVVRSTGVQVHCTTILTEYFIHAYMNGDKKLQKFLKEFPGDALDLIGTIGKRNSDQFPSDFLPKRESFFKFCLYLMRFNVPMWKRFADQSGRRASHIFRPLFDKTEWRDVKNHTGPQKELLTECGHYWFCRSYADSDECYACDVKKLLEVEQGAME